MPTPSHVYRTTATPPPPPARPASIPVPLLWSPPHRPAPAQYKKSLEALQGLLNEVRREGFSKFGFMTEEDFRTMLNTSISSLATSVCVAQKGYCLLDDDNQLQVCVMCVGGGGGRGVQRCHSSVNSMCNQQ